MNLNQITLPALDLATSVAFYRRMGFTQIVGSADYARFECPNGDSTFSLHRVDATCPNHGVVMYFECEDLDARVEALVQQGFAFRQLPTDQRWLWREARLLDPAGNAVCLYWAGVNRRHPPWRLDGSAASRAPADPQP